MPVTHTRPPAQSTSTITRTAQASPNKLSNTRSHTRSLPLPASARVRAPGPEAPRLIRGQNSSSKQAATHRQHTAQGATGSVRKNGASAWPRVGRATQGGRARQRAQPLVQHTMNSRHVLRQAEGSPGPTNVCVQQQLCVRPTSSCPPRPVPRS